MKSALFFLVVLAVVTGCGSGSVKPNVSIDSFSGKKVINVEPLRVVAIDAQHALGFIWVEDRPNVVVLQAGFVGIKAVESLAFNLDGKISPPLKPSSRTTIYSKFGYSEKMNIFDNNISYRLFPVSMDFFKKIATAKDVRMKVSGINVFNTTNFGVEKEYQKINSSMQSFIAQIEQ